MTGRTPEAAVDAFIDPIRTSLGCLRSGTAIGSGNAEGIQHSVTMDAAGQTEPNLARLSIHGGCGELRFRFAHLYSVAHRPDLDPADAFEVTTSFYQYRVLDHEENEIAIYD